MKMMFFELLTLISDLLSIPNLRLLQIMFVLLCLNVNINNFLSFNFFLTEFKKGGGKLVLVVWSHSYLSEI